MDAVHLSYLAGLHEAAVNEGQRQAAAAGSEGRSDQVHRERVSSRRRGVKEPMMNH